MRIATILFFATLLLLGCGESPEELKQREEKNLQYQDSVVALLAKKASERECYVSVHISWYGADNSVAYGATQIANLTKETWTLVSYNQEFNSRRTAIFKNKSC